MGGERLDQRAPERGQVLGDAAGDHVPVDDDRLREALRESKKRRTVELVVEDGEHVRTHVVTWSGGERYPVLERVEGKPDLLTAIITPLVRPR